MMLGTNRNRITLAAIAGVFALASCGLAQSDRVASAEKRLGKADTFAKKLAKAALERTRHEVRYDPKYVALKYPGGDVPSDTGVCTDVVIRSYRTLGHDLQKLVHEDMRKNFKKYPQIWKAKGTDKNIDHRRVPNLQKYF